MATASSSTYLPIAYNKTRIELASRDTNEVVARARPRNQWDPALKLRIALEALAGRDTIKAIAARNGVHPNLVHRWKRRLVDAAASSFEIESRIGERGERERALSRELERLKAERDFLARKLAHSNRASGDGW